ncbi:hypothetical protein E4T47_04595 [Aureobasidium subglaciale]|nr:hypothetical protein E4T47_04595 [Aureobasidium subglaciale]
MRSTFLVPALAAIVAALPAPAPQEIDLDLFVNIPTPTIIQVTGVPDQTSTYDTKAILASATAASSISVAITDAAASTPSVVKRAACAAEPVGYGPVTNQPNDDAASFLNNPVYGNTAKSAAIPSGYQQTFSNLNASSSAYGYITFTNLKSYDTTQCALKCSKAAGCMGFNIYFERDPSKTPDKTQCPNPASLTQIRCVLWGGAVTTANTVNTGRKWEQFQVVVAGSNGYVSQNIAAPSGYSDATFLDKAAINAPFNTLGYNTYMGSKLFTAGPFNATLCAEACNAQNVYNLAHPPTDGSPVQTCQFFNTYLMSLNGKTALGQYCAMYSSAWSNKYATNTGAWNGNDRYTIGSSYTFFNSTNPGTTPNAAAAIAQAKEEISVSSLQSYCSTLLGYNDLNAYVTVTSTRVPVTTVTSTSTLKIKASSSSSSSSVSSSVSKASSSLSKRAVASSIPTPTPLTKYPGSILSSACSMLVTSVPKTATITVSTATVTGATSRSTVVKTITTTTH